MPEDKTGQEKQGQQEITLLEDDLYEKKEAVEETVQLVVFRLSREWYGVEISKAKEVVKIGRLTYLPSAAGYIVGLVNLRGNILPVTDLKVIFGLPQEGLSERSRLVVIESGQAEAGLLVDEVEEVMRVPLIGIDPTLVTIASEKAEYIEGECRVKDRLIGILNTEKVLERREK